MPPTADSPRPHTPGELADVLSVERDGLPFLICRDGAGEQRLHVLPADAERVTIGRRAGTDVTIDWDPEVSRVHAELRQVGGEWTVGDQGLSRNGTYLRGERVSGWSRLRDGDGLRVGETLLLFRDPEPQTSAETVARSGGGIRVEVSPTQRRVLAALCRPLAGGGLAVPATNQEIGDEVSLSVDRVKGHMRELFRKFSLTEMPQNRKRAALAEVALRDGYVTREDLVGQAEP